MRKPEEALVIRTQARVSRLPYNKIEYGRVMAKTLYFHLRADGKHTKVRASLSDYEPTLLARPGFCKIHRSYLANLSWVTEVHQGELLTASGPACSYCPFRLSAGTDGVYRVFYLRMRILQAIAEERHK